MGDAKEGVHVSDVDTEIAHSSKDNQKERKSIDESKVKGTQDDVGVFKKHEPDPPKSDTRRKNKKTGNEPKTKLTSKERRALERGEKRKKTGTNFYEVANVKNRSYRPRHDKHAFENNDNDNE